MSTIEISDDTFEENVIKKGQPIIVDFWAEWCWLKYFWSI